MSCRHIRGPGASCLDCHLDRIARERRVRAWFDRWGPGLLMLVSAFVAVFGAARLGAWAKLMGWLR